MKNIISAFLFFVSSNLTLTAFSIAHADTTTTNVGVNSGGLNALIDASLPVKAVLLILVSLSIVCWGIGWTKYQEFKLLKKSNAEFDELFWKSNSLDDLFEKVPSTTNSSHGKVFRAAYAEMKKIADSPLLNKSHSTDTDSPQLTGLDNLERSMRKAIENQVSDMESKLTVLASTGSTGPFIGLFGTVWGIMGSFQKIAQTGSASLAAVAPGISEALIATAIGLAAAIPAVIIYNHFISVIKKEETSLNNFSFDFLNIVKRNFFKN
jgi:biopolymer transport protein TolQ